MTYATAPAYNIPEGFTGIVTNSYGDHSEILIVYVNGQALCGKSGGLRKFKSKEAAEKALAA